MIIAVAMFSAVVTSCTGPPLETSSRKVNSTSITCSAVKPNSAKNGTAFTDANKRSRIGARANASPAIAA